MCPHAGIHATYACSCMYAYQSQARPELLQQSVAAAAWAVAAARCSCGLSCCSSLHRRAHTGMHAGVQGDGERTHARQRRAWRNEDSWIAPQTSRGRRRVPLTLWRLCCSCCSSLLKLLQLNVPDLHRKIACQIERARASERDSEGEGIY